MTTDPIAELEAAGQRIQELEAGAESFSAHPRAPPLVGFGDAAPTGVEIVSHRPWNGPGRADQRCRAASTTDLGVLFLGGGGRGVDGRANVGRWAGSCGS